MCAVPLHSRGQVEAMALTPPEHSARPNVVRVEGLVALRLLWARAEAPLRQPQ